MSNMVERVAKAIADHLCDPDQWRSQEFLARAAIEAMREPTEAMQDAVECYVVGCCNMSKTDVSDVWGSMIDAALKGEAE